MYTMEQLRNLDIDLIQGPKCSRCERDVQSSKMCDDCKVDEVGEFIEMHPIGRPLYGRRPLHRP